jgi:hypothetical protein
MVTKKPQQPPAFDPWAFIYPFDANVWITVRTCSDFYIGAGSHAHCGTGSQGDATGQARSLWNNLALCVGLHSNVQVHTHKTNVALLLTVSVSFWGLLLMSASYVLFENV